MIKKTCGRLKGTSSCASNFKRTAHLFYKSVAIHVVAGGIKRFLDLSFVEKNDD